MIEIPESQTLARELNEAAAGHRITSVIANASPHSFAWFSFDPAEYPALLEGRTITGAESFGGLVKINMDDKSALWIGDGTAPRLFSREKKRPAKHQLLLELEDGSAVIFSVRMYGSLYLHLPGQDSAPSYHKQAMEKPSPLSEAFDEQYFGTLFEGLKPNLSVKALLATEQRIPGLGNGVLQDILFRAKIHPKTPALALTDTQRGELFAAVKECLKVMTEKGGRNTEKDLFDRPGGYQTILCSKTLPYPCPVCGSGIVKESYLGGSIYFCPHCQEK